MNYILGNVVPILVATLAGLAAGAGYGFVVRGPAAARPSVGLALLAFVAESWLCAILAGALILAPSQAGPWTMALGSAVVIWIGFVMPALLVTERFRGVPLGPSLLDCGHWLAVMLVQAAALHAIGLTRPA